MSKKSISMIENKRTRILAVILWVIIGFFVFRGIVSILTYQDANDIKDEMEAYRTETNMKADNGTVASAFAESFVIDYFNCDPDRDEDYTQRMSAYYADGVNFEPPEQKSSTDFVATKNVTVNGNKIDVDVQARITYTITNNTNGRISMSKPEKTVVMRVPVSIDDGNFAVTALPFYTANTNSSSKVAMSETVDDNASENDKRQIQTLTKNFLKAYYGSAAGELKYYVTSSYGNVAVVGNGTSLNEISEQNVEKRDNGWVTDVTYTINDSGAIQKQHMRLKIVKKSKYYVDKIEAQ